MTSKCQFAILGGVPRNTTAKSEVQPSPAPTPRVAVPKARQLAFVYAPAIEGLSYPPDCPFKTQRAMLTRSKIASFGLLGAPNSLELAARPATAIELQQVHSAPYLEELQRAAAGI